MENGDVSIPTTGGEDIGYSWMESNIYTWLVIGFDFLNQLGRAVVIQVNEAIIRARGQNIPIYAETAFDWESCNPMTFVSLVFVESVRRTRAEHSNVISIRLGDEERVRWV